jgi:hypothetical protein
MKTPDKKGEEALDLNTNPKAIGAFEKLTGPEKQFVQDVWAIILSKLNYNAKSTQFEDLMPDIKGLTDEINKLEGVMMLLDENETRILCGRLYAFMLNVVHMMGISSKSGVAPGAYAQIAYFFLEKLEKVRKKGTYKGVKLNGEGAYRRLRREEQLIVEEVIRTFTGEGSNEDILERLIESLSKVCSVDPEDIATLTKKLSECISKFAGEEEKKGFIAEGEIRDKIAQFILLQKMFYVSPSDQTEDEYDGAVEGETRFSLAEILDGYEDADSLLEDICSGIKQIESIVEYAQEKADELILELEKHLIEHLQEKGMFAELPKNIEEIREIKIPWAKKARMAVHAKQVTKVRMETKKFLEAQGITNMELKLEMNGTKYNGFRLRLKPKSE